MTENICPQCGRSGTASVFRLRHWSTAELWCENCCYTFTIAGFDCRPPWVIAHETAKDELRAPETGDPTLTPSLPEYVEAKDV